MGTKDESFDCQLAACDSAIDRVIDRFDLDHELYLTGDNNFRKQIYPLYKANRIGKDKPQYLKEAREFYLANRNAKVTDTLEADDLIAMAYQPGDIMVVNDKDYKQIKGKMYNPWTNVLVEITNPEYWFYLQVLTGDKSDGIPGLTNPEKLHHSKPPCYTEATANEVLEGKTPEEMKSIVQQLYQTIHGEDWFTVFDTSARLLYLRRSENDEYYSRY